MRHHTNNPRRLSPAILLLLLGGCARDGVLQVSIALSAETLIAHEADFPLVVTTMQSSLKGDTWTDEVVETSVLCEPLTVEALVEHTLADVPACPVPERVTVSLEAAELADGTSCESSVEPTATTALSPEREATWTDSGDSDCSEDPDGLRFEIALTL